MIHERIPLRGWFWFALGTMPGAGGVRQGRGGHSLGFILIQIEDLSGVASKEVQGRAGKPTERSFVESFQGRFRDECLNAEIFLDMADARSKIGAWKDEYNRHRPHSALGNLSPSEYFRRWNWEKRSMRQIS